MEKYINKDAIASEIEKVISGLRRNCNPNPLGNMQECLAAAEIEALNLIKDTLDTLEVKEVDLEKHLKEDIEDVFFDLDGVAVKGATHYLTVKDVKDIAKHFFELGLLASNPITAEDRGTAEEIIVNLKRVEQDYRIDLTKEIKWVRNKAQKGEQL